MLGLKRGEVKLVPHRTGWEDEAGRVVDLFRAVLGPTARDIQHVGSTAIRHICAKPIVDVAVAMDDPEEILSFQRELEDRGVVLRARDTDENGGILFVMGDFAADTRTCHIHVVAYEGQAWHNYINFRDYLNECPEQARRYEACKRSLAREHEHDREGYTAGKGPLIARLLEQAKRWRQGKEEERCE